MKRVIYSLLAASLFCLAGCYQMHSDDDLRTIPVTNNPNIVPQRGPLSTPTM